MICQWNSLIMVLWKLFLIPVLFMVVTLSPRDFSSGLARVDIVERGTTTGPHFLRLESQRKPWI